MNIDRYSIAHESYEVTELYLADVALIHECNPTKSEKSIFDPFPMAPVTSTFI